MTPATRVIVFLCVLIFSLPKGYTHHHPDHESVEDLENTFQAPSISPAHEEHSKVPDSLLPADIIDNNILKAVDRPLAMVPLYVFRRKPFRAFYFPLKSSSTPLVNQHRNTDPASRLLQSGAVDDQTSSNRRTWMPALRSSTMVKQLPPVIHQLSRDSAADTSVDDHSKSDLRSPAMMPPFADDSFIINMEPKDTVVHRVKRQSRGGSSRRRISGWQTQPSRGGSSQPFCNNFGCRSSSSRCDSGFRFDQRSRSCRRLRA